MGITGPVTGKVTNLCTGSDSLPSGGGGCTIFVEWLWGWCREKWLQVFCI